MRDRAMIKLGLLFMAVSIVSGVNYAVSAYNEMMGTPQASGAFVIDRRAAGEVEIGVLGQRLNVPDPVIAVKARTPEWRTRIMALRQQVSAFKQSRAVEWRARLAGWQQRMSVWQAQAAMRLKDWRAELTEQKKRL